MSDPVPAPDRGVLSRAAGIIFSPTETYRTIVAHPRPAIILFFVALVIGLSTAAPQFTERGRQANLDNQVQQIEKFTGAPVTQEMYAAMESRARFGAPMALGSVLVVLPMTSLVFAALYWFVFNTILGGEAQFKQVLAVVTHALVITALGAVIAAPVQWFQDTWTSAGPFNLGALAPMLESGSLLANFLGAISVFGLWQVIVTAIGLGVLYRRRSGPIVVGLTAAYLFIVAGVTAAISMAGR